MSEIEWKDATSYSQGQRGKVEPLSWECYINGIRVWVSQGHIAYRGEWVVSCRELGIETSRIGPASAVTAKEAQQAALSKASSAASELASRLLEFASLTQPLSPTITEG